jgi:hypothetical protein
MWKCELQENLPERRKMHYEEMMQMIGLDGQWTITTRQCSAIHCSARGIFTHILCLLTYWQTNPEVHPSSIHLFVRLLVPVVQQNVLCPFTIDQPWINLSQFLKWPKTWSFLGHLMVNKIVNISEWFNVPILVADCLLWLFHVCGSRRRLLWEKTNSDRLAGDSAQ